MYCRNNNICFIHRHAFGRHVAGWALGVQGIDRIMCHNRIDLRAAPERMLLPEDMKARRKYTGTGIQCPKGYKDVGKLRRRHCILVPYHSGEQL